jgi:phosphoribosyl 1,2-cyclic phosphodiesterase
MNIKTIASSSDGCSYIIESNGYYLIIDMGVPLKKIRAALDYDLSKVVGCIVSHEHGDHAKGLPQLEKETSIPIFCTAGTAEKFDLKTTKTLGDGFYFLKPSSFYFAKVELTHDVENYGFVIWSNGGRKKLFYATDTGEINFKIPGLTHLMIEANHSFDLLVKSTSDKSMIKRVQETHLDIDQVVEFVKRHPDLEEVHLIHLSDNNSDEKVFKTMVQDACGVPVHVAGK